VVSREELRAKSNSKKPKQRERRKQLRNLKPDQTYLKLKFLFFTKQKK
jgi:hypothetical protein